MTIRKLTATGDFSFGNSQLDFLSDSPEAVAQLVQTSLLLWLGEWYLDLTAGMPWLQGVFGKHNQSTADVTVQDFILGIQDVTDIASYTSLAQEDVRNYLATAVINTSFGRTTIQVQNEALY